MIFLPKFLIESWRITLFIYRFFYLCGFCGTKMNVNLIPRSLVEEISWLYAVRFESKINLNLAPNINQYLFSCNPTNILEYICWNREIITISFNQRYMKFHNIHSIFTNLSHPRGGRSLKSKDVKCKHKRNY